MSRPTIRWTLPHPSEGAAAALGVAFSTLLGIGVSRDEASTLELSTAALGAILLVWSIRRWGEGVLIGLLLLGALDALPGPNVETTYLVRTMRLQDGVVACLVVVLLASIIHQSRRANPAGPRERLIRWWSLALVPCWLTASFRPWLAGSVPLFNAMFTGRDFLYLAMVTPLITAAWRRPQTRTTSLVIVLLGTCLIAAAQIVAITSGASLTFLIHSTQVGQLNGLTRIYSGADNIILVGVPFGLGLVLLAHDRRLRLAGGMLTALSVVTVLLEQTRAEYIGLLVGVTVTTVVWLAGRDKLGRLGRRRVAQIVGVTLLAAGAFVVYRPPAVANTLVNGVVERFASTVTDFSPTNVQSSTITVRQHESTELESYLGSSWLLGDGFLDASYDYIPVVPGGSIRNPDVGVLNVVMTMGILGAVIYYFPFVLLLVVLMSSRLARRDTSGWVAYGAAAWIITVLASSLTLVVMFSPTGVMSCSVALSLGCLAADGSLRPTSRGSNQGAALSMGRLGTA